MGNAIKYSLSGDTQSLNKGNFWIGVGDTGKGPTSSTSYWNGITPPASGYTIYLNRSNGVPSAYPISTNSQLISLTNSIGSQTFSTSTECLNWFATQSDKMAVNIDYPTIVTTGLSLNLDAGYTPSYPTTGTTWYDSSQTSIINLGLPLTSWYTIRSVVTDVTGTILPPFSGASVWSSVINTSLYPNTLHRIWSNGAINGIIGTLGSGFYRYYMWVRGAPSNSDAAFVQNDISDGGGSANSTVVIGKSTTWQLVSTQDIGGSYNAGYFFDYSPGGSNGDTFYISSIVIARYNVPTASSLTKLGYFPSYINYGETVKVNTTLVNGPTFTTSNGGGVVFDGVDDLTTTPVVLDTSSNFTVEVISKCSNMTSDSANNRQSLWSFNNGTTSGYQLLDLEVWGDAITSFNGNGTLYSTTMGVEFGPIGANNYNVYTLSMSGGVQNFYLNSVLKSSRTPTYTGTSAYFKLATRGNGELGSSQNWNGQIMSSKIYNRALSSTEVLQNYQSFFPRLLGQNIVTSGLVLDVDAGYLSSYPTTGTSWYDVSGYGNNGTLTNGSTYSSSGGGSIVFDGVDDYVPLTGNITLSNTFTIMGWVKMSAAANTYYNVYGCVANGSDNWFGVNVNVVDFYGTELPDVNNFHVYGTTVFNLQQWYHITSTINVSTVNIYTNAILETSTTKSFTIAPWNSNGGNDIGRRGGINQNFFNGNISSVYLYNKTLSSSEVLQNYQATFPRILGENIIASGLVLYLDAGYTPSYPTTGTTWNNISGVSGNTGTLTNGPTYSSLNGGSIVFDGVDDFISIPTYTFGNGDWTLSMWVNAVVLGSSGTLVSNSSSGPVSNQFGIAGSKIVYWNYAAPWQYNNGNTTLSANTWYMLTWVNYAGASNTLGTMQMFVNGVSDSSIFNSYTTNGGPCNAIGKNYTQSFNGKIATTQIYNRSLSSSEVTQNYNAQKSRFGL